MNTRPFKAAAVQRGIRSGRQRAAAFGLAVGLHVLQLQRVHGEDHFDYRYEYYQEDAHRVRVETHSGLFEKRLTSWLGVKGEVVYDAISGASPTGAPPPSTINFDPPVTTGLSRSVPLAKLTDTRYAGTLELPLSFGRHRITPQYSDSEESDYISYGAALNYSVDLNEKNTTLNAGWSHTWDTILLYELPGERKYSDDYLVGVNQLLGPKTVLTVNFTYGNSRGYLNDQYKGVLFESDPQQNPDSIGLTNERRPEQRDRYVGYASLTRAVPSLDASIETSYRFYHDTYGVDAHTLGLNWFQKIGKHVVVSPLFRYYLQSEASFYATRFPDYNSQPEFYSADYRLSELETFTYGVMVSVKPTDWLTLDAGYKRYVMHGLDGVTSATAYPAAHVATVGARIWF